MRRPLVIVALLVAAAATYRAADARTDAFTIGVMRRDGALIPFAAFDGKRWSISWPAPQLDLEIPINLESVPKAWWGPTPPLREWQLVSPTGEARMVRVTQPDWVETHCARQVALKTDYRSPQAVPPPSEQPYPKDGLVIAPPPTGGFVGRIDRVAPESDEARSLADAVRDAFNRSERETADRFNHPIRQQAREQVEIRMEAVYASGTAPRIFYVEASRGYTTDIARDAGCAIAFGTGWFVRDKDGASVRKLDMAVDLLPCNRYGGTYMLPFGVIRIDDRTFWIVQYSGWDHERYVVADIRKDTVDAAVIKGGGGC